MNTEVSEAAKEDQQQRQLLRDSVIAFAKKDAPAARVRQLREASPGFDRELWRSMVGLGWVGLLVPESVGGLGLGLADMAVVAEELGRVLAPEPVLESAAHAVLALSANSVGGAAAQLLGALTDGELIPIVAWQEGESEPGATPETTRAKKTVTGYVLDGRKIAVPLGADADGFIVSAVGDAGVSLFWVAKDLTGVQIDRHVLCDGSHNATIVFNAVSIPADALLCCGQDAENALAGSLDATCILTSAYLLGLMSQALEMTLEYLRTREQFGRPIGSFQVLQHRAVNLYIQRELSDAVVNEAIRSFDACTGKGQRSLFASRAKYRATEAALAITRDAIQMHGAIGYTDECDIGLYLDRAMVLAARLGNLSWHCRRIYRDAPYCSEPMPSGEARLTEPADGNWNAMSDEGFRAVLRAWYSEAYPSELRYSSRRLRWHEIKDWYMALSKKGWVAPNWPVEYGGMGLDPSKQLALIEEQERWGIARAPDMGIIMVGPLLIKHGTDEQRKHYLPKILAGEHIWCQGYSEPNAGSDLASLRTEAVLDGDEFVVNGQKTWTTLAQDATHIFLLARTDKTVKKQAGISFLLMDITTPGITIRPIRNIAGHEEFCEVFFDDVRAPADSLVGGMNNGWTIAKALLGFERIHLGSPKQSQYALQRLANLAEGLQLFDDAVFIDRFTRLRLDVLDLESTYTKFADIVKHGGTLGPDVSLLKIWATETFSRVTHLMLEAAGSRGVQVGKTAVGDSEIDVLSQFYNSLPSTIYGGSNEIQRNILAKNVLKLPDA